uniref:CCR4-NOT transcription complex subunit 4 n=1 Tax=Ditylenchus dipsaci TaxID=166011 RepID=A0A915ECQ3_9BILA
MSSDEQSDKECPLCMEAFDEDINFFPCNCQYQICRFCWHRLKTDDTGLVILPSCRQPFPDDPVNFQPLSSEQIKKIKTGKKKQKSQQQQKTKLSECRKYLSAYRVLQKNLVYVVGLSQRMADADLLRKADFFGKFGKISKIAVVPNNANSFQSTSYTAYVTYVKTDDALRAIQTVNNLPVDGRLLKASLGTTKYCSSFLKGQHCSKQECMYLHHVANDQLSFTKEDMHLGKHIECERKLHEQMNTTRSQSHMVVKSVNSAIPSKNCRSQIESTHVSAGELRRDQIKKLLPRVLYDFAQHPGLMPNGQKNLKGTAVPLPERFDFFLDLYDDPGFDPHSESSKALAELVQEEEKTSSTS